MLKKLKTKRSTDRTESRSDRNGNVGLEAHNQNKQFR